MAYTLQIAGRRWKSGWTCGEFSRRGSGKTCSVFSGEQGMKMRIRAGEAQQGSTVMFSTGRRSRQTVDKWIANKKTAKLWNCGEGFDLDWASCYGESKPAYQPADLPVCQGAYWIDTTATSGQAVAQGWPHNHNRSAHPLLTSNTSN